MSATPALPPVAVMIRHRCADFATWKAAFDADEPHRKAAGMLGHHINRSLDDPNDLSIFIAATDLAKAQAFASSPRLKDTMQAAGITSAPQLIWMKPMKQAITWDRETPAMLVVHPVADVAKWMSGYAEAQSVRDAGGITGDAVNCAADNSNLVVVYHQAASHATLKAFAGSPELKTAMQKLGVTGAPEISFHTGGWGKMYQ